MSQYRDPYSEQQQDSHNQQYGDASYDTRQPHQAYDQGGYDPQTMGEYRDDPNANPQVAATSYAPAAQEMNPYEQPNYAKKNGRQSQDFKTWRGENTAGLWTRGSRVSCIGRFCCCTMMIAVFLIVSILLALLMWVRPPDAIVGNVGPSTTQNAVQLNSGSITVNLGVNLTVVNPNYFGVSFKSINVDAYYPINNTLVGTGQETDITFNSNSQTNFTFPFSLEFSTNMTSSTQILTDLATKCGVGGGAVQDITIDLDITVGLRVLFFVVYPVVSIPASFACPISASDISSLIPSLTSLIP
ncbi:uncharacterized protein F5891DRAFT_1007071 [Suillus fuscotomentosus]|uniref:Late embryogenesis abundant protein LEA-2 subgroup domain-containing protein n=1 Tax=Suillus fuscotomentosus TaxID=1912939 RepID=A0AAD4HSF9_9AGAM|nr:uncharacterized protein F5891DRAFT_1007071 [Suillus fuscotomentosus]KAG1905894.1 hypothetical protein F5891DRAFT_1007071 [Suillus fuscotomentosus]